MYLKITTCKSCCQESPSKIICIKDSKSLLFHNAFGLYMYGNMTIFITNNLKIVAKRDHITAYKGDRINYVHESGTYNRT